MNFYELPRFILKCKKRQNKQKLRLLWREIKFSCAIVEWNLTLWDWSVKELVEGNWTKKLSEGIKNFSRKKKETLIIKSVDDGDDFLLYYYGEMKCVTKLKAHKTYFTNLLPNFFGTTILMLSFNLRLQAYQSVQKKLNSIFTNFDDDDVNNQS